ncbi:Mur ligase family protein [Staphylococcus saprophyticus]|uniref:Mur ligase family protein n=1 Tax=Staphylococcus saprophyticus TaxID=29385 RepID=UPI003BF5D703
MQITIQDILLSIEKNTITNPTCMKVNTNTICQNITSMYQDIKQNTIFMLKDSDNTDYYAQRANEMKPLLMITDAHSSKLNHLEFNMPIIYINNFPSVANNLVTLFYGKAIDGLKFIAVTGTNGKTTTSHMIGNLLSQLGKRVAIIGTLGIFDCNYEKMKFNHTTQTTPMYFEMGEITEHFYNENYDYIVYEATSIALDQRRTDFIQNDLSVFTNFSPEHLEYHGTMNNYLKAKLRLNELSKSNLVNLDTTEYNPIVKDKWHFSNKQQAYYQYNVHNSHIDIAIDGESFCIKPNFKGGHNYINLATSIFSLHKLGFATNDIIKASTIIEPPAHRFQIVEIEHYTVILDFAHTALAVRESINNALQYTESIGKKLNTMVTGIGLRGFDKMGMTVEELPEGVNKLMLAAEQVGYEDPKAITEFMIEHLPHSYKKSSILKSFSRKEGIRGLLHATDKNNEVILLTGINEPQNYKGKKYDHDDQIYIKTLLQTDKS